MKVNVLCTDGVRRIAFSGKVPFGNFTISGSVRVKGKSVSGYILLTQINKKEEFVFFANPEGKNGRLLPKDEIEGLW